MFGTTWQHDVLRKYVVLFGTMFNNISVNRLDSNGDVTQTLKVPLSYGPKNKFLARATGDPNFERQVGMVLPRMAFEMKTFEYDASRKLNTLNKRYKQVGDDIKYTYQPVPYNIVFDLYIMVKNAGDGTRIVEQILPYFTPEWTPSVELLPDVGGVYDVPVVLNSVSNEDLYEGSFEQRRMLIWTLTFTMKGYVFGPVKTSGLIKFATTNMRISNAESIIDPDAANTVVFTAQPGLTANGTPTSNSAESVSYTLINSDDDYGFINIMTENL